jgi:hypothetical protein
MKGWDTMISVYLAKAGYKVKKIVVDSIALTWAKQGSVAGSLNAAAICQITKNAEYVLNI